MTKTKKLLAQTASELVEGRELLAEKKRKLKAVKRDKLGAANAKLAVKIIEQAVESIADHREILKSQLAIPSKAS